MRLSTILRITAALVCTAAGLGQAEEKALKPQEVCPVMGFIMKKDVYLDFEGRRMYFCCPNCIEKFKADPVGYLKKMEEQGYAPASIPAPQTKCPVMGGDIDKNQFTDHQGKRIYFCCPDCKKKFQADPEKYMSDLKDKGIDLENTPAPEQPHHGAVKEAEHEHQHQH